MEREELSRIFVGRKYEIDELRSVWAKNQDRKEHFVYVYFNTPGIGKTTLLDRFGDLITKESQGLHLAYSCTTEFTKRTAFLSHFVRSMRDLIKNQYFYIEHYIELNENRMFLERSKQQLLTFYEKSDELTKNQSISSSDVTSLIQELSQLIPLLLTLDEVQDFEKVKLSSVNGEETETLFHYLTTILKGLLRSRVLIILSGTQYHLLRQIGSNIGSPIKEKTLPKIISPLRDEDLASYCWELRKTFEEPFPEEVWENLEKYLKSFSGGHPRTITKIVTYFSNIERNELLREESFEWFVEIVHKHTIPRMVYGILRSDQNKGLIELQKSNQFSRMREWLTNGVYNNMALGDLPTTGDAAGDAEIERLVFNLQTIGIIVQNGQQNYYLTSYFHLLLFLETFKGEHELFLREVLHNRFFHLLCGSHAGFGYTFEHILLSALFVKKLELDDNISLPIDMNRVRIVETVSGEFSGNLSLEEGKVYHFPNAKGLDFLFVEDHNLVVTQVTTQRTNLKTKVTSTEKTIKAVQEKYSSYLVQGWFLSLFDLAEIATGVITFTTGTTLRQMLGEQLYKRLTEVKRIV